MDTRDDKGGRSDIADSKCLTNSLNQNSLTCTKWAIEKDEIASYALRTDALTKIVHLGGCSNLHWLRIVEKRRRAPGFPEALPYLITRYERALNVGTRNLLSYDKPTFLAAVTIGPWLGNFPVLTAEAIIFAAASHCADV
ncbi:unannotated protein [freshwater metagenome]|uniref:Unannotated protein n=1 Tax=freshwater metagenome TaxID=449393 RepID=A0A6J6C9P3_9ZZZZ